MDKDVSKPIDIINNKIDLLLTEMKIIKTELSHIKQEVDKLPTRTKGWTSDYWEIKKI